MKKQHQTHSAVVLYVCWITFSYWHESLCSRIFTIIGPDGRPLVIQKQTSQRSTGHSAAPSSKASSNPVQKSYPTAPTDASTLTPAVSITQTQTSTGFISSKRRRVNRLCPLLNRLQSL